MKTLWLTLITVLTLGAANAAWQIPPEPFNITGNALSTDLDANSFGNAIAIWEENSSGSVLVSYFSNNAWGPYQTLDTGFSSDPTRVAIDDSGTGLALWYRGFTGEVKTSYFNGSTWATPPPDPLDVISIFTTLSADIAMDGNGNGIAIWVDPTTTDVRSSTFSGGSWTAPTTIGVGINSASVAYSLNGAAVAGWVNAGAVVVNNYIGGVWQGPLTIDAGTQVIVGIDFEGNAIASWLNAVGDVVVSYFNGTSWSLPQTISNNPGNQEISFDMSPNGTAVLTWVNSGFNAESSSFNGATWSPPIVFAFGLGTGFSGPKISVSVDIYGNALVTWQGVDVIYSARLLAGSNVWIDISIVNADPFQSIIDLTSALSATGRGFAVWRTQFNDENSNAFGSYTLDPLPPFNLIGRSCSNRFASQTDRINILTWTPSSDPLIVAYYLRNNGNLIAVIPAAGPYIYNDHGRCKNVSNDYTLTAVNIFGQESASLTITLR